MQRLLKYLIALLFVLLCIYLFWLWLQYKWATVVQHTTASIMTELKTLTKLETVTKTVSKTVEGKQELASLVPWIGIEQILNSALFKEKMVLSVQWELHAGYLINDLSTGDIQVSRDGTVTIILWNPLFFWITLTGTKQTANLAIVTQKDKDLENQLREWAGQMMIQEALSGNLLEEAKNNAQEILQTTLLRAGIQIKRVILQEKDSN